MRLYNFVFAILENHMVMPEVEISPGNQSVSEGADAMFYCSATGYPTPTVEWMRGRPSRTKLHPSFRIINSILFITVINETCCL